MRYYWVLQLATNNASGLTSLCGLGFLRNRVTRTQSFVRRRRVNTRHNFLHWRPTKQLLRNVRYLCSTLYLYRVAPHKNTFMYPRAVKWIVRYFPVIKTTGMHYFSNLFWYRTIHVSYRFTVHHQDSSTVHTAISICHTGYADCLLAGSGSSVCRCVYSTRLLLMERKPVWNMWSSIPKINLRIWCVVDRAS